MAPPKNRRGFNSAGRVGMDDCYDDYDVWGGCGAGARAFQDSYGTVHSLSLYFGSEPETEYFFKTFPPHTKIDGVPHICNPVPKHVGRESWRQKRKAKRFRGLIAPVVNGPQMLEDNIGAFRQYGDGEPGGIFITPQWTDWLAVGSGFKEDPTDIRDRLENGDAHAHRGLWAVRVMQTVRRCSHTLPDEELIEWRKESTFSSSLRVRRVEVQAEERLDDKIRAAEDPIATLRQALETNVFTAAFIGMYFPDVFTEGKLAGEFVGDAVIEALNNAVIEHPEIAAHVPSAYVWSRIPKMTNRHRLPEWSYRDPEIFWETFLLSPALPGIVPWDYAEKTFAPDVTNQLKNRFTSEHPHYLWMLPAKDHTPKRINRWLNTIEHLWKVRGGCDAEIDRLAKCYMSRGRRNQKFAQLNTLDEKLTHPVFGPNFAPVIREPTQFARVIMTIKMIPPTVPRTPPPSWWTAELLDVVIGQVKTFARIPQRLLTEDLLVRWAKANAYVYERLPEELRTARTAEAVVLTGNCAPQNYKLASPEHRTVEMARVVAKNLHTGYDDYIELFSREFLLDDEVIQHICRQSHIYESKWKLYEVFPPEAFDKLDDQFVGKNCGLWSIPQERITDALSRRAHISSYPIMTETVQAERLEEHEKHEARDAWCSRGCYDYHGYDDYDHLTASEEALRAEQGH